MSDDFEILLKNFWGNSENVIFGPTGPGPVGQGKGPKCWKMGLRTENLTNLKLGARKVARAGAYTNCGTNFLFFQNCFLRGPKYVFSQKIVFHLLEGSDDV